MKKISHTVLSLSWVNLKFITIVFKSLKTFDINQIKTRVILSFITISIFTTVDKIAGKKNPEINTETPRKSPPPDHLEIYPRNTPLPSQRRGF